MAAKEKLRNSRIALYFDSKVSQLKKYLHPANPTPTGGLYIAVGKITPYYNYEIINNATNNKRVESFLHVEII